MSVIREADERDIGRIREIVSVAFNGEAPKDLLESYRNKLNPLFLVYDVGGRADAFLEAYSSDFRRSIFPDQGRYLDRLGLVEPFACLDTIATGLVVPASVDWVKRNLVEEAKGVCVKRGISHFYTVVNIPNPLATDFLKGIGARGIPNAFLNDEVLYEIPLS